jgi:hypothetical protein
MSDHARVIARLDRAIQGHSFRWMPRSSRGMTDRGAGRDTTRPAHRTEGSARTEGGRKAPARGGGSGAARAVGPGGCKWQVEALK